MRAWIIKVSARSVASSILFAAAGVGLLRLAVPATASPAPVPVVRHQAAPRAVMSRAATAAVPAPAAAASRADASAATAAATPLAIKRILDTGGPIRYGSYFWDDGKVPDGPLTITIDLKASVLSVFRGGYEIGTTAVIYGADDRETPLGTFPILQKDRHHVSNLYHAPMPYMLRLTGDGVSIHASEIAANYATHGCIGVPAGFAKRLFEIARVGDRVIVTKQGLRADVGGADAT